MVSFGRLGDMFGRVRICNLRGKRYVHEEHAASRGPAAPDAEDTAEAA